MGREVKRVPMDFDFPIGQSFADAEYYKHCAACEKDDHDDCEWPYGGDGVPKGDGWQLWQTVSDGPISPVFATADELIDWMCQPDPDPRNIGRISGPWAQGWRRAVAEPFVKSVGWAPSLVSVNGALMDGATYAATNAAAQTAG